ncbi:hypothetical protein LC609_08635 [Nostoc sp. XA013]|nr:hypothetical protein [Nostoc sp. XA013]
MQDKISKKINSYDPKLIQKKIEVTFLENELDLVKQKSSSVIWGLEFIIHEASDDFIQETLDYIFGNYIETHKVKFIELEHEINNLGIGYGLSNLSFGKIKKILDFELNIIKQADKILSNDKIMNNFFAQMYKNQFSDGNAVIFN